VSADSRPECQEVLIDLNRALSVGDLIAVELFTGSRNPVVLLTRWLGSSRRDDRGYFCEKGYRHERVAASPRGLMLLRSDLAKGEAQVLGAVIGEALR